MAKLTETKIKALRPREQHTRRSMRTGHAFQPVHSQARKGCREPRTTEKRLACYLILYMTSNQRANRRVERRPLISR